MITSTGGPLINNTPILAFSKVIKLKRILNAARKYILMLASGDFHASILILPIFDKNNNTNNNITCIVHPSVIKINPRGT